MVIGATGGNYWVRVLDFAMLYVMLALGLNVVVGFAGLLDLGYIAFYAVGAYTSAILMEHANMNYALTLPISGIICFAFGYLFGKPALRLSGVYLALATFALATAMPQLLKLNVFEPWTGGVQGLVVDKPDAPFGLPMSQDMWLYYFTLAITIGIYLLAVNLLRSRSGRAFMAIRDNERARSGADLSRCRMSWSIALSRTNVSTASSRWLISAGSVSGAARRWDNSRAPAAVLVRSMAVRSEPKRSPDNVRSNSRLLRVA